MGNIESNLYVTVFVPKTRTDLCKLSELEGEINQERQWWLNSGAAEEMAELFYKASGLEKTQVPSREFSERVMFEQASMFGNIDIPPAYRPHTDKAFGQLPVRVRNVLQEIESFEEEHRSNYQKAVKPLIEQRRGIEGGVYGKWLDFMDSMRPVGDFSQFLSDLEFEPLRGEQRPFLGLLSRRLLSANGNPAANLNNLIGSKVVETTVTRPEQDIFNDFLESLSNQKQNRAMEVIWQWLRLMSYPNEGVDQTKVFEQITGSGIFPADLRGYFTTYIQGRLSPYFLTIIRCLGDYKPTPVPRPAFSLDLKVRVNKHQHKGDMVQEMTNPVIKFNEDELPAKPVFELATGTLTIEKAADGLAPHDERMRNDVGHMVEAVTQDPFGLGVSKLTDYVTLSLDGSRKLPLRRFRADKRPFLIMEHPDSRAVRVVYHIDKIDGRNTVVIHDILNHQDFDRKYNS